MPECEYFVENSTMFVRFFVHFGRSAGLPRAAKISGEGASDASSVLMEA